MPREDEKDEWVGSNGNVDRIETSGEEEEVNDDEESGKLLVWYAVDVGSVGGSEEKGDIRGSRVG